jgi:hypothetical protein
VATNVKHITIHVAMARVSTMAYVLQIKIPALIRVNANRVLLAQIVGQAAAQIRQASTLHVNILLRPLPHAQVKQHF